MLKKNWPINSLKIFQAQEIKALIMELEVLHLALEATKDLEVAKVAKALEATKVTKDLEAIKVLEEIKALEVIKAVTDKTSHHKNNK